DVIERAVPGGAHPDKFAFAVAGAQVLTGAAFVYLTLRLGARTRRTDVSWPHRVFVLILLAGGVIASAGGLVIALQAFVSALLGAAPDNWQQTARTGIVTLLVGGTLVAIFATIAARHRYLVLRQTPKPLPAPPLSADTQPAMAATEPSITPDTLEGILDEMLAGRLSRDEAASRIWAWAGARSN
ncbi:MAG TPA: hypothetical protein VFQ32_01075, partial [Ktedonobacterales bacterium]|nr:hypothetical protein [Ktedonobacterales bacterium]